MEITGDIAKREVAVWKELKLLAVKRTSVWLKYEPGRSIIKVFLMARLDGSVAISFGVHTRTPVVLNQREWEARVGFLVYRWQEGDGCISN